MTKISIYYPIFLMLVICPNLIFAEKMPVNPNTFEEKLESVQKLNYSDVSDVKGLYHQNLSKYAELAGIDLKRVVSILKIKPYNSDNSPIWFSTSKRYKNPAFHSNTAQIFEILRVNVSNKRKILVLFNSKIIDMYNVENFHKGWQLAELSDTYELEKLHNLFNASKHPWPGGEAIHTNLNIKNNNLIVEIIYEQPIRGYELHTKCKYLFHQSKGFFAFKKVSEVTEEGPVP